MAESKSTPAPVPIECEWFKQQYNEIMKKRDSLHKENLTDLTNSSYSLFPDRDERIAKWKIELRNQQIAELNNDLTNVSLSLGLCTGAGRIGPLLGGLLGMK